MTQPEIGNGQHPHDNSGLSSSATTVCYLFRCSCCCCKSKKKKEQIPSLCSGLSLISYNFRILFRCWRDTPGIQKQSTERHWQIKKSNGCATLLQLLYCTSTKGKASLFSLFDEGSIRRDRQDRLFLQITIRHSESHLLQAEEAKRKKAQKTKNNNKRASRAIAYPLNRRITYRWISLCSDIVFLIYFPFFCYVSSPFFDTARRLLTKLFPLHESCVSVKCASFST